MNVLFAFACVANLLAQEDPVKSAPALIRKLGSNKTEERYEAARTLKGLGKAALPELERAAVDPDPEIAQQVRRLIRLIPIAEQLTPRLRSTLPGVEERLAEGDARTWCQVFFEATAVRKGKPVHPDLHPEDLEALAARALQGTDMPEEQGSLCESIARLKLRAAVPDLLKLLKIEEMYVVEREDGVVEFHSVDSDAVQALVTLNAEESIGGLVRLLTDGRPMARQNASMTLGKMKARSTIPEIKSLLQDKESDVRRTAADALCDLEAKDAAEELRKLLADENGEVRVSAAKTLTRLGLDEGRKELLTLLRNSEARTRSSAVWALKTLNARDAAAQILPLLEDADHNVRTTAVGFFASLGIKEAIPKLRNLLKDPQAGVRDVADQALKTLGAPRE